MKLALQATPFALAMLFATGAQATDPASTNPATHSAELAAAQADLQRDAQRIAALSRATGSEARALAQAQVQLLRRPMLGVVLAPDGNTVRIAGVTPESAAAKAGLRSGDRLTAVDGTAIRGGDADARLENARALLGKLEAGKPVRLAYARDGHDRTAVATPQLGDRMRIWTSDGMAPVAPLALGVDPAMRAEILRLKDLKPCEGNGCRLPLLADAFRWNGLNLAAVNAQLGRYFGTSSGVLVLSTGESLAGLEPGDVLRSIDGKRVATPREAMAALQARPAGSRVNVEYLRDRKPASMQITVPKPFSWPVAPRAPMPPRPAVAPSAPSAMNDYMPAPIDGAVLALAPPPSIGSDPSDDTATY